MENVAESRLDGRSLDVAAEKLARLRDLMPEAFSEGKLDVDKLRLVLGEDVYVGEERYGLNWPGKAEAYKDIQRQTTATLVPDRDGSVEFDTAENVFIEGENLEVLRVLQKSYFGKVKMIYIDPPYNTGSDAFMYADDFSEKRTAYEQRAGITDDKGYLKKHDLFRKNSRENGQFHSVWLSMMLPRLHLAHNLLHEDGVIFISIDDNEVTNLRPLLDEIFGEPNFVCTFIWRRRKTQANLSRFVSPVHDYILCYAKNIDKLMLNRLPYSSEFIAKTFANPDQDPRGAYQTRPLAQPANSSNPAYEMMMPNGKTIRAKWSCSKSTFEKYLADKRVYLPRDGEGMPRLKVFLSESEGLLPNTWLDGIATNEEGSKAIEKIFGSNAFFVSPKPPELIKHLAKIGSKPGDLILDFFAGSGTTAEAVIQLNNENEGPMRQFICVQLAEKCAPDSEAALAGFATIDAICRHRIKAVIQPKQPTPAGLFSDSAKKQGFKTFHLAKSNFPIWNSSVAGPENILNQLALFSQQEPTASPEAMLYELLLKKSLSLTSTIEQVSDGCYVVNNTSLFWLGSPEWADAAANLEAPIVEVIALEKMFASDERKTNIALALAEKGINLITV